ncbi:MAG: SCP2 sterol-binding domain-containing protein [Pseudomonadales bacterium]|jgi:putative sterol carrier protein|nr:SCP2 sterol-binding domain-containing protein [Pseudomonadales bacterium]MDA0761419.1 SCP2 sterol-binding domain-containing protein [Pseudomonadota bacterium]MDA0957495.1 SCP2 sterol-binding domain-containing protein [Pseudomonadota bacterium]MDA1206683.1 SCP2 sterol-binding domain-containing protein [Pseudomonadota bacterium]
MNAETTLKHWQTSLKPKFRYDFLPAEDTIFQFRLQRDFDCYLEANSSSYEFLLGHHEAPTLTLYLPDASTLFNILSGDIDGMEAFMAGDYRADGNIILSQLLLYLFQKPHDISKHQVID